MMTLADWCRMADVKPTTPTTETGAVSLLSDGTRYPDTHAVLWKLSDYRVSSINGLVVWLLPC